jgi:hypothetical protein
MTFMLAYFRRPAAAALTIAAVLGTGACGDSDPAGPIQAHDEPAGLIAELEGAGVLVSVNAARQVTGGFTVAAGAETDHIHLHFINEVGDELEIGTGYWLKITATDASVVGIEQHEAGELGFHLVGLKPGSTTVVLDLMHGTYPNGHIDYRSPAIAVTVTAAQ